MRKIDRFDKYMQYKNLNDNKVTKHLGLSVGTIGKSRQEGRDLSDRVAELILNFYTDLNKVWLLTGEGEMITQPKPNIVQHGNNNINNSGVIGIKNSTIDNRQYYSDSPDVLRAQIDQLERLIEEKEARIAEKDKQIAEKDKQIAALIAAISK